MRPPLPAGFVPPHVNPVHQRIATFIGATMWFWIFYRAKQDGGVVLVRIFRAWRGFALNSHSRTLSHHRAFGSRGRRTVTMGMSTTGRGTTGRGTTGRGTGRSTMVRTLTHMGMQRRRTSRCTQKRTRLRIGL